MRDRFQTTSLVCALVAVLVAPSCKCGGGDKSADKTDTPPGPFPSLEQPEYEIEPTTEIASSPALVEEGRAVYARRCAPCHGDEGKGDGQAAYLLYPKPRNFYSGRMHFVSTWEGYPTDNDLYRIISRGVPGSAMPSWAHLTERSRWSLVHFVKTLPRRPIQIKPTKEPESKDVPGQGIIALPTEPVADQASLARGAEVFAEVCAPCHGPRGLGDGKDADKLVDDEGIPIRPRDLTTGVFKGSHRPEHLYRRVLAGIPGTPMPSTPMLQGDDAWHVVHFVRSLSSDALRERAEMKRYRLAAARVAELPDHPDSGVWQNTPGTVLHLMPLWWRYNRPEYLTVQAAHDGSDLVVLLTWADESEDNRVIRPQDFRDAAAVEFADNIGDPPFFGMGEHGQFVNLWMWKAEREADLAGFNDLEAQYPNTGIDSYPNLTKSPYEQPMRHALTLDSDPTFITAWGAGNIVSDPTRRSAAEDLSAQGFGTLLARPLGDQDVHAHGVYTHGSYRVMFRRSLKPKGEKAMKFEPGDTVLAAFAIWNGSAGDRDGKKSVSIWQELVLLP